MWELVAAFVGQSAVIVFAATLLVRYSDALGEHLKLGRTLAGFLLLAVATSLPELFVGCSAAMLGEIDLAAGNLLGSSLFNLLILAILDLCTKTRGRMFNRDALDHAMTAVASMLLTVLVLAFILLKLNINFGGIGVGSLAIGFAYLFTVRMIYHDQQFGLANAEAAEENENEIEIGFGRSVAGYVLLTAVIFYIAPKLAETSGKLATESGLGGTFFGTTFVALITSLPEAITTFSALRLGLTDMAIGNILGSNTFNMVMFIALDLSYGKPLLSSIAPIHAITASAVILVTCVALLGLLYRVKKRWWVFEPDAVLVIILVVGSLTLLYRLGAIE